MVTINDAGAESQSALVGGSVNAMMIIYCSQNNGLVRELNPGPLAPKARIMPLDQRAR